MPTATEVVQAASLALARTLELDTVLETLLDCLAHLVPYDSANVMLLDDGRLGVRATRGYEAWPDAACIRAVVFETRTNPIFADLLATQQSVRIADTRAHPGWEARPGGEHVRCWMGVPLSAGGVVLGLYSVDKAEPGFFTAEHQRRAESLAPHAALAIQNARLHAAQRAARAEAERLQAAACAIGAMLEPHRVYAAILAELRALVPYDSAAVMQLDGGRMRVVGGHGFPNVDEVLGVSFDLEADNPNHEVARALKPVIVDDAPARYPDFRSKPHAASKIRSWLGVPLLFGGRLVGMLAADKRQPAFFTVEHARVAESFAAHAAVAMENARLFAAARRELAERERAEARQHAFVEQAPYGVVVVDAGRRIVLVNREAERLFGYARTELLGEPLARLVPERLRRAHGGIGIEAQRDTEADPMAAGGPRPYGLRKDGSEFPMDVSLRALDVEGAPLTVAAFRDVTERERAQDALRERTWELKIAVDAARMGVWRHDVVADRFSTIQGGGPLSGLAEPLYPSRSSAFFALVHPDDRAHVAERVRRALEEGTLYEAEFRIVLPERGVRWVSAKGQCQHDAHGRPTVMIGVDLDVTEARQAEEALRASEARYRALFQAHPLPMWIYDLESLRFLAVNDAATLAYGWSRDEFLGMTLRDVRPAEERPRLDKSVAVSRVTPGYESSGPWRHLTRDGRLREVEIASHDVLVDGRPARLVAIHDVTEKRELEAQFLQSQKLEAVGRLAGGIAHDFNNMLGVILGFAELALKRVQAPDPVRHSVERIVEAAERSAALTRQLLAFARRQPIAPRVLDLNTEIAALVKTLVRLVGEDIRVVLVPGHALWHVKLDPVQLGQVLTNLATNARDAVEDVGTVTIATSNASFDEAYCRARPSFVPGEFVELTFGDSGTGMDAVTRERIFEPFFTTKPEGKGTGLGLATVYGIVRQNGGFIDVSSEPGHGTTFRIYLPRCLEDEPSAGTSAAAPAATLGRGETLLLVEDEPQLLELAREALESLGYTVLSAPSPGDALNLCEAYVKHIDLLLTDVVMPDMNGRQLFEHVRRLRPGIRALFMSGYTANAIAHRGVLEAGVCFIEKPFTLDALAAKVREALAD